MLNADFSHAILSAFVEQEPITVEYRDEKGRASRRSILIHNITHTDGKTMVCATDLDKSEVRTFRLVRMVVVRTQVVTQDTFLRAV